MYQRKAEKEKKNCVVIEDATIDRVKKWDNGGITFDLTVNGVKIYGCRIVEGNKGDFIAFPQRKGTDGKYYSHVYVTFSDEDQKAIIADVRDLANGQ